MAGKTVHVHLGPHKTGSSAIQQALRENADVLKSRFGLTPIPLAPVARAAKFLNADRLPEAAEVLQAVADRCAAADGDSIISCEDLSGPLPGARGRRKIYTHLWRNLSVLEEALRGFELRYYFFLRQPEDWIKSAYIQNLKYRQKFSRLEDFAAFLKTEDLWYGVIEDARKNLGASFSTLEYPGNAKQTAMQVLLSAIPGISGQDISVISEQKRNVAPSEADVFVMERINRSGASQEAKRRAKLFMLSPDEETPTKIPTGGAERYEPPKRPADLSKTLDQLWKRVEKRVHSQDQINLMPNVDADLREFRNRIVVAEGDLPEIGRGKIENQAEILVYRFRDCPETCFLLGLVISYLRRDTPHTRHASILFQRLWAEEYPILLGTLPTRWLISSFQTFLDHGINEHQRVIGSGAYFFANMLKAYETERALEGLAPDATYPNKLPQTKMGFSGLDRFRLGGSDLILNTNALLLEYSARDDVAGRVVQEFLARARTAQTIFSRMDKSRQAHGINIKQFSNCWSFFEEP